MPEETVNSKQYPIIYSYMMPVRYFMLAIAFATALYSLYFLVNFVYSDTPTFFKVLPLVIVYVSIDTMLRHLTGLNKVVFERDHLVLKYLVKKPLLIPYAMIRDLELKRKITYYVRISYEVDGKLNVYQTNASFPKMLKILLCIYEHSPNLNLDPKFKEAMEYISLREQAKDSGGK